MDQARLTSKKAIRRKLFPSKRNHPKKPRRPALAVMRARKNTTTSVAVSTGVTTSAAQIVIRRIRQQHRQAIRGRTRSYPSHNGEILTCSRRICCAEVSHNCASVVTLRQRRNSAGRFITRCSRDRSSAVIVTIHTAASNSSRRAYQPELMRPV